MFDNQTGKSFSAEDIIAHMKQATEDASRAAEVPAWALYFRSPFKTYKTPSTSWLGGVPCAPSSFKWPRADDGRFLHFFAQIDLSQLEAGLAFMPVDYKLPSRGAMVFFADYETYQIIFLSDDDLKQSHQLQPPKELWNIDEIGYFGEGQTFNRWDVDPQPFISTLKTPNLADPFENPNNWIDTWGIAALDVKQQIKRIERELNGLENIRQTKLTDAVSGKKDYQKRKIEERYAHYAYVEEHAPTLLRHLLEWSRTVQSNPQHMQVDPKQLDEILQIRADYNQNLSQAYAMDGLEFGDPNDVWRQVLEQIPDWRKDLDFTKTPPEYQTFVERRITSWRGHRLFGLEPPFPNNTENLRGYDPILSIHSDDLLMTASEHDYGLSVWLEREAAIKQEYHKGQLIRHCAV